MTLIEAILGLAGNAETAALLAISFFKVTILLGLALLLVTLLPRSHPDRRHLLLRLTLAIVVLLPLLSLALPTLNFRVFDTFVSDASLKLTGSISTVSASDRLASDTANSFSWTGYLVLLWLSGTIAVMLHIGYGLVLRSRIRSRSRPVEKDSGLKPVQSLADELEIHKSIYLAVSSAVGGPVAWSFPKPTIILGTESVNWSYRDLRLVLTHELCHVKRRDDVWMLVGALATAIHWYNPLVWLVRDRLTLEADNVCDGYVVHSGADSTVYARFMVAMARQYSKIRTPVTIGSEIISKKQLEVRIMSIQDKCIRSIQVRRSLTRLAWVLTLAISIPVAAIQLADRSDSPDVAKKPAEAQPEQSPSPDAFVRVDSPPVAISLPTPVYPDSAKKVGLEGALWVQALVDRAGNVAEVRIKQTSGHECFDRAGLETAKKGIWKPAMLNGQAVSVWASYEIKFQLRSSVSVSKKPAEAQPEQSPSPDAFVRVDSPPVAISLPTPVYPDSAKKVGLEGALWVQALVDRAGNVAEVRIKQTSGHECFDRAGLETAKKGIWKPAMLNGQAVSVWASYEIKFQLRSSVSELKSKN